MQKQKDIRINMKTGEDTFFYHRITTKEKIVGLISRKKLVATKCYILQATFYK